MIRVVALTGLALVVALALTAGLTYRRLPAPSERRVQVAPNIVGIHDGWAFSYIIWAGRTVVLVDTGADPQGELLIDELARLGFSPEDVAAVLITHGHFDHWAATDRFSRARVYLAPSDLTWVKGLDLPKAVATRLGARVFRRPPIQRAVEEILPGAVIRVGPLVFDTIPLPGHTPGLTAILHAGVLFVGDALFVDGDDAVRPPPGFLSEDPRRSREVLERLHAREFVGIADGHAGYAVDGKVRYERWRNATTAGNG